jgi:hypothetical protein
MRLQGLSELKNSLASSGIEHANIPACNTVSRPTTLSRTLTTTRVTENIVTRQPIVGLRYRALLGSRPANNSRPNTRYTTIGEAVFSPCRAEPNRTLRCYTTGRDDVTRHHAPFRAYKETRVAEVRLEEAE